MERSADTRFDVAVIGAGIAGTSVAAELSADLRVLLLEQEEHPGYHSTGRSAALFSQVYGNPVVRALSRRSRPFFESPPPGFSEYPLISLRGALFVARPDQAASLDALLADPHSGAELRRLSPEEAVALAPLLRRDQLYGAGFEPNAYDVDVHVLQGGYLRKLRAQGGTVLTSARVERIGRDGTGWEIKTSRGTFSAPVIVNAAGAWADEVAALAGIEPLGLRPLRRTAVLVEPPAGADVSRWPLAIDVDEGYYVKPDAGLLLLSACDETLSDPCDAYPEELDVAIAIDRVQQATTLEVTRVKRSWAGLRTFAADRILVIGYDDRDAGFFWLAGQGGYGVQTSPAAARTAASLVRRQGIPQDLRDEGLTEEAVSPARLRGRETAATQVECPATP